MKLANGNVFSDLLFIYDSLQSGLFEHWRMGKGKKSLGSATLRNATLMDNAGIATLYHSPEGFRRYNTDSIRGTVVGELYTFTPTLYDKLFKENMVYGPHGQVSPYNLNVHLPDGKKVEAVAPFGGHYYLPGPHEELTQISDWRAYLTEHRPYQVEEMSK